MCCPRPLSLVSSRRFRHRRLGGFTLPELALAALVLLLAAGLALTGLDRMRQRRNCDNYVRDLRVMAAAFDGYFQQHHSWPPSSSAEVALPSDLAKSLAATPWFAGSPFGGSYAWVAPEPAGTADQGPKRAWAGRGAVTLTAFLPHVPLALTHAELLRIDRQIDDANLATGRFRTGFNGWPVYFLEAAQR